MSTHLADITGQVFGKLTVLGFSEYRGTKRRAFWNCQCECGIVKAIDRYALTSGNQKSCGCMARAAAREHAAATFIDLTGHVFGKLTVVSHSHVTITPSGQRKHHWLCRCDCGVEKTIDGVSMKCGHAVSCGCHKAATAKSRMTRHGHTSWHGPKSPTYNSWRAMMRRCYSRSAKTWNDYGGRGIIVCDQWHDFVNFLADVGECPGKGYSIDRYPNNDGNYEPNNCRWATMKQQCRNTRRNKILTLNGESHCVAEWSEILGISCHTIRDRLNHGASDEDALSPLDHRSHRPMDVNSQG